MRVQFSYGALSSVLKMHEAYNSSHFLFWKLKSKRTDKNEIMNFFFWKKKAADTLKMVAAVTAMNQINKTRSENDDFRE